MNFIRRFCGDSAGATLVEYGVALALIGLLAAGGMGLFSSNLSAMVGNITNIMH